MAPSGCGSDGNAARASLLPAEPALSRASRGRGPEDTSTHEGIGDLKRAPHILVTLYLLALGLVVVAKAAQHFPHYPGWWLQQAACIRSHEGWPTAATGNGYEGSYQFLRSTWQSTGGRVDPRTGHWASVAPLAEQTYRAWLVWQRDGGSWSEWGTAGACGLR